MIYRQPPYGNRNNQTHGRPASRGSAPEQASVPILERFTYDAYGQQKPVEGSPPASPSAAAGDGWNYQFQGGRVDLDAGLMNFRQRDMHPGMAWWMDQEPSGYVDGLNVYAAPVDEPVNRVDPLGT